MKNVCGAILLLLVCFPVLSITLVQYETKTNAVVEDADISSSYPVEEIVNGGGVARSTYFYYTNRATAGTHSAIHPDQFKQVMNGNLPLTQSALDRELVGFLQRKKSEYSGWAASRKNFMRVCAINQDGKKMLCKTYDVYWTVREGAPSFDANTCTASLSEEGGSGKFSSVDFSSVPVGGREEKKHAIKLSCKHAYKPLMKLSVRVTNGQDVFTAKALETNAQNAPIIVTSFAPQKAKVYKGEAIAILEYK